MGLLKMVYLFTAAKDFAIARNKMKRDKQVLKEIQEKDRLTREAYDNMIAKTRGKIHATAKAKVLGKDKTLQTEYAEYQSTYYTYETCVELVEDLVLNGVVLLKKGQVSNLTDKYDYMSCSPGDYVDVHFHLRIDENGDFIKNIPIFGEPPMSTLQNCREKFLSTP